MPNERAICHGKGFNFLTFDSSLHAVWPNGGERNKIVNFSFKLPHLRAGTAEETLTRCCHLCKVEKGRPAGDNRGCPKTPFLNHEVAMRIVAPMIVASCLIVTAAAGQEGKTGPRSSDEPRSTPGTGHKYLEKMAGNWQVTQVFYPRQGQPVRTSGECRQTMIQDGKFLQSEFVFNRDGGKSTGLGIIGFEPETGRFTSFWVDSRQTRVSARQSRGPFDGREIVLYSVAFDPQSKESRHSKTISHLKDGVRKLIHRQFALGDHDEERLVMELILTRKP